MVLARMTQFPIDKNLVLIPARMASTRLPGKPLADINGQPMIVHVAKRAQEARIGRVVVAVDDQQVFDVVKATGFDVVMTASHHQSGSDRIYEALTLIEGADAAEIIINVQGDLPTIDPQTIVAALKPLENAAVDIATLAVEIAEDADRLNPNIVKVIGSPLSESRLHALYFTRATAPYGPGPLYHHIGLYAYRRAALQRFVSLAPSVLEKRESLEQLRALEAQMRIDVEIVDTVPLGVDTAPDLDIARRLLSHR